MPTEQIYMWALTKKGFQTGKEFGDFKSHRTAVLRGSNISHLLHDVGFKSLVPLTEESQLLKMLVAERVDFIVGSEHTMAMRLKADKVPFESLQKIARIDGANIHLSLAFSIDSDVALVERFKQAFEKLDDSGELTKIRQNWSEGVYASSP